MSKHLLNKIYKYRSELIDPKKAFVLAKRWWKIFVAPPKEKEIFIDPSSLTEIYTCTGSTQTATQPKQIAITPDKKTALVSCMSSKLLQFYDTTSLDLIHELEMPNQCVEVTIKDNIAFATTTDFKIDPPFHNQLSLIDIKAKKILSSVDTNGRWSKVIAVTPDGKQALVSNWKSSSISVIDVTNHFKPKLIQIINIQKCPRGIAFTSDGKIAIVANFYSGNIAELQKVGLKWKISFESKPFDIPNFPGNPRHVLISADDSIAYISNKGRNLIHFWSIPERKFIKSIVIGKGPNTIDYVNPEKNKILVSCSQSDRVFLLDLVSGEIKGISPETGKNTTGMCNLSQTEFLATGFDSNTLEKFTLSPQTS